MGVTIKKFTYKSRARLKNQSTFRSFGLCRIHSPLAALTLVRGTFDTCGTIYLII
jgi:hypothetical protein